VHPTSSTDPSAAPARSSHGDAPHGDGPDVVPQHADTPSWPADLRIAVLVPCFNEEVAIGQVIAGFRASLPGATIHVYDNNSTDRTVEVARDAGALVARELRQGKGHVVRRMFADIDADVYVLVDGDATYDAAAAPAMVQRLLDDRLDMVVGRRVAADDAAYRAGHRLGNRALNIFLTRLFGQGLSDILSGYRVFSRRFVKTFPAIAEGFETETELSVHALELRVGIAEVDTVYHPRPDGSESKLSTWRDGLRIGSAMLHLYEAERPRRFFSVVSAVLTVTMLVLAWPILVEYANTGLVSRIPTAVLAASLGLLAALSFLAGTILQTVTRGRRELKRLHYLQYPPSG
jgi:glycosyltransferase involved in cell wall biosynthesis